jgi:hypothetical protein
MKQHHFNFFAGLFFLFTFLHSTSSQALLPYKYPWIEIKTPHFTIVVEKDLEKYGQSVAGKAEEAFERLQKLTKKHPKNTYIIVDHTKGFSNGSATFFPYPIIRLQPIMPDSTSSVGQYKDWLLELLIHEYTHILSFHNTKGLFTPLRWVLGSTISPGYFQPTWYQEGIAVYTESHLSNGGRLRSASYNAYKKELKAFNVALANEQDTNLYPFGSAPYIYGGWLNQDLLGNDDLESASKLHRRLSGRIPYFINGAYKKTTGTSVYKSWRKLFSRKKTVSQKTKNKELGTLPQWNEKKQSLYFTQLDPFLFDQIVKQTADGKQDVLLKARNIIQFRVFNDSVYYLSLRIHQRDHQIYSLYKYDSKTKKTRRLKTDRNIKGFDVSNRGLLLLTANLNNQSIRFFENFKFEKKIDWLKSLEISKSNGETRLGHPLFMSSETIAYTFKPPGKNEKIFSHSISSSKKSELFSAEHVLDLEKNKNATWALFENKGQKELVKLGSLQRTTVSNGIQQVSPKGANRFVISDLSYKGFFIAEKSLEDLKQKTGSNLKLPIFETKSSDFKTYESITPYSSFTKLRPHYVMPNLVVSPYGFSGEFLYGVSTGGQDPLGLHNYTLSAITDSITNEISYGASYTSNHFRLPVELSGGVFYDPITLDFYTRSTYAKLSTSYPLLLGFTKSLNLKISALVNTTSIDLPPSANPNINLDSKRAGVSASFSYDRSETRIRELAPRKGYTLAFGATHYIDDSDYFGYTQSFAGFRKYFTSPLHKKHRLVIGVDGQKNDRALPGIFATNSQNQLYRNLGVGGFALRGLPTSSLAASDSFLIGHLEYRFPIVNINWGPGLLPGFFQRITGALTGDYGSVKGFDRILSQPLDHSTPLYSAGAELIFEGNAFYHVPASLQIGIYKFLNTDLYDSSPEIFVGFGLSGLPF